MGIAEMLNDVKTHFEHGAQLAESHIGPLVEWAIKAEGDPLVQAALSLIVPDATKQMLAGLLKGVEADVQRIESEATANAAAAAAAAATPAPEGEDPTLVSPPAG